MLNQVHDYLGYVPLARISAMNTTAGRKWQLFSITLSGGQEIELEARGAIHELVASYRQSVQPAGEAL